MYNPSDHKVQNIPFSVGGIPLNAKSLYYDKVKFIYRPYISVEECLSYIGTTYRTSDFSVVINTGGTINPTTGKLIGGVNSEWWWKDGVSDDDLIQKEDPTKIPLDQKDAVNGIPIISDVALKTTIDGIRALSGILKSNLYYSTDLGKEGSWYYDSTDTTSTDNTGSILVDQIGRRFKRVISAEGINLSNFDVKGVGDESSKIKIAADFSADNKIPLIVSDGTYTAVNVDLKSNLEIKGSPGAVFKTKSGAAIGSFVFRIQNKNNIKLSKVTFDGNYDNVSGSPASGTTLLQILGSSFIDIHEATFKENKYLSVLIHSSDVVHISNSNCINTDSFITTRAGSSRVTAMNCHAQDGTSDGFVAFGDAGQPDTEIKFIGCTALRKGVAFSLRYADKCQVIGSSAYDCAAGIGAGELNTGFVTNSIISGNIFDTIKFDCISNKLKDCIITHNKGYNIRGSMIRIGYPGTVEDFPRNQISFNQGYNVNVGASNECGIILYNSTFSSIEHNEVFDTRSSVATYAGISVQGNSNNNFFGLNKSWTTTVQADILIGDSAINNTFYLNKGNIRGNLLNNRVLSGIDLVNFDITVPQPVSPATTVTLNLSTQERGDYVRLKSTAPVSIDAITVNAFYGKEITFYFDNDDITFVSNSVIAIPKDFVSKTNSTLKLKWVTSKWVEVSRNLSSVQVDTGVNWNNARSQKVIMSGTGSPDGSEFVGMHMDWLSTGRRDTYSADFGFRNGRFSFRTKENAVQGSWFDVYHTGNITLFKYTAATASTTIPSINVSEVFEALAANSGAINTSLGSGTITAGVMKHFKNSSSFIYTVSGAGGFTIDGIASYAIPPNGWVILSYVGANNYALIASSEPPTIIVSNTTDVVTKSFLNSSYSSTAYRVGTKIVYPNQGMKYERTSSTDWTFTPTNILA